MEINKIKIGPPKDIQIIVAQSHFIKTVEDVYECLMNCVPNIKFGVAFYEDRGQCLVRYDGNDEELKKKQLNMLFHYRLGIV